MTATASGVVQLAESQFGARYVYGAKWPTGDPDPKAHGLPVDCSGYVHWSVVRAGVADFPDGSYNQYHYCRERGLLIDPIKAEGIRGALLFLGVEGSEHVVISRGDGSTAEARGAAWGVGSWSAARDQWSAAALIPGVSYAAQPTPPTLPTHTTTTEDFVAQLPMIGKGAGMPPKPPNAFVRRAQGLLCAAGHVVTIDGKFWTGTDAAARAFQSHAGLPSDGIIGPKTWGRLLGVS